MDKSADAFRTISEVAEELDLPQHVLRFWETRFPQIKPLKRAGGRRYYRPRDVEVLRTIKHLLYGEGYTIKGVQRVLKEQGIGPATAAGIAANETRQDLPLSSEREFPAVPDSQPWQAESGGNCTAAPPNSKQPEGSRPAAGHDDGARMTSEESLWPFRLSAEDIARLRAALAELAECEDILAAARRR
jgi:DNA-binding transcriptional MerR regulator